MVDLHPPIVPFTGDNQRFVNLVSRIVLSELEAKSVHGLFVVRIENWFDHKWLNFSGKGRVAFGQYTGMSYDPDTALDPFHRTGIKTTFPPFTPSRVISQYFYGRNQHGSYVLDEDGPWIHASFKESSSTNIHRRIATRNNSALFAWFSSNTESNGRGSLMIYRANGRIISSWYVSFLQEEDWRVVQIQGIPRQHLLKWLKPVEAAS